MKRNIGILLTCVDDSEFASRFPDDGEKFRRLLQPLRPDWTFTTIAVKDNIFPEHVSDYDGYIITGSPKSVHGDEPWIARLLAFIRTASASSAHLFGACFGHQAIALALGGTVEKSTKGWGLGTHKTHYTDMAEWMVPAQQDMTLFAAHEDQVTKLPEGATLLGGDAFCPIGAYRIGNNIFATEYHPEMTKDFVAGLLDELEGDLDDATIARARNSLSVEAEGQVFAQWIVKFFDKSAS
jgi:GMP synthase-like glutamine amidotransferase